MTEQGKWAVLCNDNNAPEDFFERYGRPYLVGQPSSYGFKALFFDTYEQAEKEMFRLGSHNHRVIAVYGNDYSGGIPMPIAPLG